MKELTIEQKAQRYDEALRIAQELYNDPNSSNVGKGYICTVFPELKENEDEGIRKKICKLLWDNAPYEEAQEYITWIEKQGESDETKAKVFLINKGYPIDTNGVFPTYEEMYNIIREGLEKQGEQEPVETEKGTNGNDREIPFSEQEWSEEDEHRLKDAIYFLDTAKKHYASTVELDACIDWFKSLKDRIQPQTTWKPTKEQMDALLFVVQHYTPNVTNKLAWDSIKILELMYYEIKH